MMIEVTDKDGVWLEEKQFGCTVRKLIIPSTAWIETHKSKGD